MKRKEICEKTGLTPKALRLYEEKGLIAPRTESAGHNRTREYSQEDLELLRTISTLRRAMFTISEIKEMLEHPETIQDIYPQYLQWLRQQRDQLTQLLSVSSAVDISQVSTAVELTRQLRSAADTLPMPAADIHFNFRRLEELEEPRPSFTAEQRLDARLPDRTYRQSVVAVSRAKWDNLLGMNDFLNDTRRDFAPEDAAVGDSEPDDLGLWQKLLRAGLTLGAILTGILTLLGKGIVAGICFAVLLFARLLLGFFDNRTLQKRWVGEMGWNTEGFALRKKFIVLALVCGIVGIGLVAGSIWALAEYLRPVEPSGGPSTEGVNLEEFWEGLDYTLMDIAYESYEPRDVEAITPGPDRIYFVFGRYLYSINADYTELCTIDDWVCITNGAKSIVTEPQERPCKLVYYDGCIYFLHYNKRRGEIQLMCQPAGEIIRPQTLASGEFQAIGLSEAGEIICYTRLSSKWTETLRVPLS